MSEKKRRKTLRVSRSATAAVQIERLVAWENACLDCGGIRTGIFLLYRVSFEFYIHIGMSMCDENVINA